MHLTTAEVDSWGVTMPADFYKYITTISSTINCYNVPETITADAFSPERLHPYFLPTEYDHDEYTYDEIRCILNHCACELCATWFQPGYTYSPDTLEKFSLYSRWVAIGSKSDDGGAMHCLHLDTGNVYWVDFDRGEPIDDAYIIATSFTEYLMNPWSD